MYIGIFFLGYWLLNIIYYLGNISVNNDNGNNIKLTMGTIIIFNIILRKFISYEVYIFIGNDTKKDIRDIYIIFSSLLFVLYLFLYSIRKKLMV